MSNFVLDSLRIEVVSVSRGAGSWRFLGSGWRRGRGHGGSMRSGLEACSLAVELLALLGLPVLRDLMMPRSPVFGPWRRLSVILGLEVLFGLGGIPLLLICTIEQRSLLS